MALTLVLVGVIGLAVAWKWSPLTHLLDFDGLVVVLRRLGESMGMGVAIGGFALAVTLAVPLTFVTLVAILALGAWNGVVCAIAGALVSAALSFAVGCYLGRDVVGQFAGQRVKFLSVQFAQRGVLAVVVLRLVPIAPFAVVNMVAGATPLRLPHLLLGTAIGMLPSTLAMAFFWDQLVKMREQSTPWGVVVFGLTVVVLVVGGCLALRWMRARLRPPQ